MQDEVAGQRAGLEIESDQIEIDVAVTKSQMIETEGKLARMAPVRYQLLRPR